ncbi:hypothetical protein FB451DRAFT_1183022 [Mycena latifolia]|nr:hypothetical protein FB451DRAFT_1183022 [Mycena latifolia]
MLGGGQQPRLRGSPGDCRVVFKINLLPENEVVVSSVRPTKREMLTRPPGHWIRRPVLHLISNRPVKQDSISAFHIADFQRAQMSGTTTISSPVSPRSPSERNGSDARNFAKKARAGAGIADLGLGDGTEMVRARVPSVTARFGIERSMGLEVMLHPALNLPTTGGQGGSTIGFLSAVA